MYRVGIQADFDKTMSKVSVLQEKALMVGFTLPAQCPCQNIGTAGADCNRLIYNYGC